jgi:N-acetylmuramoyl-L-alanine amidase
MKKLYLSPSTQENNYGAGNFGTEEFRMNQIADKVVTKLKDVSIKIYRNKPNWTLNYIVNDSNAKKVDLHLAIHSNAGGGKGTEVYCYKHGVVGEQYAKILYNKLSKLTPWGDRGVKQGYNFYGPGKHMYEVAYTNAPAALVEIDFHDNKESAEWMLKNMDPIAAAIVDSILEYFKLKKTTPKQPTVRILKKGMSGEDVKELQKTINRYFGSLLLDEDGQFGPLTYNSVLQFQKTRGIQVDGIVGPETQGQLKKV